MRLTEPLYSAIQMPVFQNRMFLTSPAAQSCLKGDVVLVQDMESGLVFNRAFSEELVEYDAEYQNEQGLSKVFHAHLLDVIRILDRYFRGNSLLEIGCGKGRFLELLQSSGFQVRGLDPTYEGSNPSIMKRRFTPELGLRADALILRHVLEHVPRPVDFLQSLLASNGGGGSIYIEVPSLDWISEHRAWFDIFYEHVNYFRLSDLTRMFGRVIDAGHLFSGQYIYILADLTTLRVPTFDASTGLFHFPSDFSATIDQYAQRLVLHRDAGRQCAIWGCAAKGVIFAHFMHSKGAALDLAIDINPAKHDKYLASTGLRVSRPEEALELLNPGDDVYIMNNNYLTEIESDTCGRFNLIPIDSGPLTPNAQAIS